MSARTRLKVDVDFDAKGKHQGFVRLPHSSHRSAYGAYPIPVWVAANGSGPTILLTAGNHGDEYEGQIALLNYMRDLDPARVEGRIIAIPMLNYPAAMAGTRTSPVDDGNLNRAFPGDAAGTATFQLAHFVESVLMPMAQYGLDLHSGGSSLEYLPCAMSRLPEDEATRDKVFAALRAFGAPLAVVARSAQDDRTLSAAALRRGVAQIATEIGGGGTVTPAALAVAERGIARLLAHLGIVPGPVPATPVRMTEIASADHFVVAPARGLFEPAFALGDAVVAGQPAGRIHFRDEPDRPPRVVPFAASGLVVCRRVPAPCEPGDCLAHLASDIVSR